MLLTLGLFTGGSVAIAGHAFAGAMHETTEILTHSHGFETEDAVVNAIGALIGVAIQRTRAWSCSSNSSEKPTG